MTANGTRAKYPPICVGDRFGRLLIVSAATSVADSQKRWNCACDCGVARIIRDAELKRGASRSCGCLMREINGALIGERNITHGQSSSRAYVIWQGMRARCLNETDPDFKNYGARGITVCERWMDFASFFADMGEPEPDQTLDREKNELGYGPQNCRWVSRAVQNRNKRNNAWVVIGTDRLCFADACAAVGVGKGAAYSLMKDRNLTHQEAIDVYVANGGPLHRTKNSREVAAAELSVAFRIRTRKP